MTKIKDLKRGEYFKRKESSKTVFKRGEYCAATKKYSASPTEDMNRVISLSGDTKVFTEFEY